MKYLLLAVLLAVFRASGGELPALPPAFPGRLIVTNFLSAPFPHPSRAAGRTYRNEFFPADQHYADSTVALFVPKDLCETGRVDFVVHFHGWRNTVAGTLRQYRLIEQLMASGRNAVLLVPEGPRNAPDSGGGKLEDPNGFERFMDEALATLKQRGGLRTDLELGDIILSGHSGAYQVMSAILDHGGLTSRIKEVWLFDALYAQNDRFLAWAQRCPGGRLLNIYTDGGGTKARTEEMIATLREQHQSLLCGDEATVRPDELRTNHLIFLHTDLTHNQVVAERKTFQLFLETSRLGRR